MSYSRQGWCMEIIILTTPSVKSQILLLLLYYYPYHFSLAEYADSKCS